MVWKTQINIYRLWTLFTRLSHVSDRTHDFSYIRLWMILWYMLLLLLLCMALFSHCDQSRPWHISAYQHITFTASLWLCMTSCLQRGSGLTNRRKQLGKKIQPAYSNSQCMAVRCVCVFSPPLSFLYTGNVFDQKRRGRYTLKDECTLKIQCCTTAKSNISPSFACPDKPPKVMIYTRLHIDYTF